MSPSSGGDAPAGRDGGWDIKENSRNSLLPAWFPPCRTGRPGRRLAACGRNARRGSFGGVSETREIAERVELVWSQRLEDLAERLYRDAEGRLAGDPLARVAVVVGQPMRGEWLKEYHLFGREGAWRRILAGMDVLALHPFVGDWLYAALEGKDPGMRRPSSHPYSMEVLRWRIDPYLLCPWQCID